jgi:hypothetical protein
MIAAGVNAKALSECMGHSKIAVTMDLYGHLMPGNESEASGFRVIYDIFEGTAEIQQLVIARAISGMHIN